MKFDTKGKFTLRIRVGKTLVHIEENVTYLGIVNRPNINGNVTYQFKRMQQKVGQKETFAVSEKLIL